MNRKPDLKAAAEILSKAFAAQGTTLKHQAALNLAATIEGFESYAHWKAAQKDVPVSQDVPNEFTVHLIFGEDELEELEEARQSGAEDELEQALTHAKTFSFASQELRDAFMEGVDAGCGWLDHQDVTDEVAARQSA